MSQSAQDLLFGKYGGYNQTGSYGYGVDTNPIANQLYQNVGDLANSVYDDARAIWDREDSSYQRMVEDMRKAGLNPWAGISSGGLSTSNTNPSLDSLSSLLSVLGSILDSENTFTKSSNNLYTHVERVFGLLLGKIGSLFS